MFGKKAVKEKLDVVPLCYGGSTDNITHGYIECTKEKRIKAGSTFYYYAVCEECAHHEETLQEGTKVQILGIISGRGRWTLLIAI